MVVVCNKTMNDIDWSAFFPGYREEEDTAEFIVPPHLGGHSTTPEQVD